MSVWEKIKYEFFKVNSASRKLLLINVGVFLLTIIIVAFSRALKLEDGISTYLLLPASLGKLLIRPWAIVTNIFMHGGIRHILGNMLILYFIGKVLEQFVSNKKIYTLFLGGGIAGGLAFLLGYNLIPSLIKYKEVAVLLGASGGVSALVVAAGFHIPSYRLRPFGMFEVEMKWVAVFLVVVMNLITFGEASNDGGLIAHIGGALFGFLFIKKEHGKIHLPKFQRSSSKMKTVHRDESKRKKPGREQPGQEEIDAILDKISQSGYNSLSEEEKQLLFNASE